MRKISGIVFTVLVLMLITLQHGCSKSTQPHDVFTAGVEILEPAENEEFIIGQVMPVVVRLTGPTSEYSQIRFMIGSTAVRVLNKTEINSLASGQENDAEFEVQINTEGREAGNRTLTVEVTDSYNETASAVVQIVLVTPVTSGIDFNFVSPDNNTEYFIGDRVYFTLEITGDLTLLNNVSAFIGNSNQSFYSSSTRESEKIFSFSTEEMAAGYYFVRVELETVRETDNKITKSRNFSLIEYIPTFAILGNEGYELKSIIQTYDNGYLTLASDETNGTRVVKYDFEGNQEWAQNIAADVGVGESVVEDIDYDKGYVIAGWRQNGAVKDTWVRKINHTNGTLIWNKHYGFDHCNDGATVIRRTVDDGYIIGGWTENFYGTDPLEIHYEVDGDDFVYETTWETGLDVRLIKIYSNGNEVWGHRIGYCGHKMWHDISLHKHSGHLWVRKMGDQMITDLIAKEDGNYYVTGWNNNYLYYEGSPYADKKDMFFAEVDNFGGFASTMTWSRMGAFDMDNLAGDTDPYSGILNIELIGANHLGDLSEDEIGYGIVESQGGYGGDVVMVGETHQQDDGPVKARLHDAWVVEFAISGDEDGAFWEYAFGQTARDDKAFGIDRTRDGGYIVTGYRTATNRNTWLFKLDQHLMLEWSRDLGVAAHDWGTKVLQTKDGGFIIGGNTGTLANPRARIIKVNKTGHLD